MRFWWARAGGFAKRAPPGPPPAAGGCAARSSCAPWFLDSCLAVLQEGKTGSGTPSVSAKDSGHLQKPRAKRGAGASAARLTTRVSKRAAGAWWWQGGRAEVKTFTSSRSNTLGSALSSVSAGQR